MSQPTGCCLIARASTNPDTCILARSQRDGRWRAREVQEVIVQVVSLPDDVACFVQGLSVLSEPSEQSLEVFGDLEWLLFEIWQRAHTRKQRFPSRAKLVDLATGKLPIRLDGFPRQTKQALRKQLAFGKLVAGTDSVFSDVLRRLQIAVWNAGVGFGEKEASSYVTPGGNIVHRSRYKDGHSEISAGPETGE